MSTRLFLLIFVLAGVAPMLPLQFLSAELSLGAAFAGDDDDDDDDEDGDEEDGGSGGSGDDDGDDNDDDNSGGDDDDDDSGGGDSDDGGGGDDDGGDDDGGDDDGGNGGGDDDDDGSDDDKDDAGKEDDGKRVKRLPRGLPKFDMQRGSSDRSRKAEISGLGLDQADIDRLLAAGFELIESRPLSRLDQGVAARFNLPPRGRERAALELARQSAPDAIFDLSHVYGESQGASVYAPGLVQFAPQKSCGAGIRVGLIDGAVVDHPMLAGAQVTRKSFSADNASAMHGTAVASIMVGQDPEGRALLSRARLFSAAVFTGSGKDAVADVIDLVAAIDWMATQNVGVVNMSIAGPENELLRNTVARAAANGMIIVAAGGNGGANGKPRYPAAYPDVIAVSAVDERLRAYRFNSRGAYIDVAAPGVDIWAADARGGSGALWSGTSFAAPFVTVELAAARKAGLVGDAGSAAAYLARRAQDLGAPGPDAVFGAGLMQSSACR